jgi:2-methylisocitrate lyase-like PEP mutase family enzyme
MTANQEFTALHHGDRPFVLPNAWDVGSGLFLADAGFPLSARPAWG